MSRVPKGSQAWRIALGRRQSDDNLDERPAVPSDRGRGRPTLRAEEVSEQLERDLARGLVGKLIAAPAAALHSTADSVLLNSSKRRYEAAQRLRAAAESDALAVEERELRKERRQALASLNHLEQLAAARMRILEATAKQHELLTKMQDAGALPPAFDATPEAILAAARQLLGNGDER